MAIWQFRCNIIPNRTNVDELSLDELLSWEGVHHPSNQITFLERAKTWTSDIIQYGKSDETCIEFVYEGSLLKEIECRLDLRNFTKSMLAELLEYIKKNNAVLWVNGKIYSPELKGIVEVMKHSEANLFCKNPKEYILKKDVTLE